MQLVYFNCIFLISCVAYINYKVNLNNHIWREASAISFIKPFLYICRFHLVFFILLYNETKLDEMAHILDHYMTLVPTVKMNGHLQLSNADLLQIDDTTFFSILFGGDQLTVARVRGGKHNVIPMRTG